MRLSEFWLLAHDEFGRAHAETLVADLVLAPLDATAAEALEAGVPPRTVWQELCEAMAVPAERRGGRDHTRRPAERTAAVHGEGHGEGHEGHRGGPGERHREAHSDSGRVSR